MKLYLSSIRIPVPEALTTLLDKPLSEVSVAVIPNAQDYFSTRARDFKINDLITYMQGLGLKVDIVDLRDFDNSKDLKSALADHELVWAMGGNTFMLRYEMQRSGFDEAIKELLKAGVVYGGDSAGALVAGTSIAGIESADEPAFAEKVVEDGMNLVPFVIMPHVDNPEFTEVMTTVKDLHKNMIELKDSQAVIFDGDERRIVEAKV
jgi:dipeptidase E